MYFEARAHVSFPVADAAAAVAFMVGPAFISNQCPVWTNANGHLLHGVEVNHRNLHRHVVDVAVGNQCYAVESLTFGWMKDTDEKIGYVQECESDSTFTRKVTLCIDGQGSGALVTFECSCCGTGFKSTIAEQAPRDQDAGFGHCPGCIERFGDKLAA